MSIPAIPSVPKFESPCSLDGMSDALLSLVESLHFESVNDMDSDFDDYLSEYEPPGQMTNPSTQDEINLYVSIVQHLKNMVKNFVNSCNEVNWNFDFDYYDDLILFLKKIKNVYEFFKLSTRLPSPELQLSLAVPLIKITMELLNGLNVIKKQLLNGVGQSNEEVQLFASVLDLRLEMVKFFQNVCIRSNRNLVNLFLQKDDDGITQCDEYTLDEFFKTVLDTYYVCTTKDETVNQHLVEKLSTKYPQFSIVQTVGLNDLSFILRGMAHLLNSGQSDAHIGLARNGFVGIFYQLFITITNTKLIDVENDKHIIYNHNEDIFSPYLFHTTQNIQLFPFRNISKNIFQTNHNINNCIGIFVKIILADILRPLLLFGLIGEDHESTDYLSVNAFGDNVDVTKSTLLFHKFVLRSFNILSAGIQADVIPTLISDPIDQIILHNDVKQAYLTPIGHIGYDLNQEGLLDEHRSFIRTSQTVGDVHPSSTDLFWPIGDSFDIMDIDNGSVMYIKILIMKILQRLPLKLCPFIFLHKFALACGWKFFNLVIETLIPGTTPNELQHIPTDNLSQEEHVDRIWPVIKFLIAILQGANEIEKEAMKNLTPEKGQYFAKLGLRPLSAILKELIYGQYASIEFDKLHRDDLLTKMIEEADEDERIEKEEEEKKRLAEEEEKLLKLQNGEVVDEGEEEPIDKLADLRSKGLSAETISAIEFLRSAPPRPKDLNTNMIPAGGLSERLLDDVQNTSLKAKILLLILNGNMYPCEALKEFLWELSGKNAEEFIRLCGFGRAIGWLSEQNVGEYAGFAQKHSFPFGSFGL
jgi:hypothetical protein